MSAGLLQEVLKKLCSHIRVLIGSGLSEIILYGSYARGDFDMESDIDIALIINEQREHLGKYRRELAVVMSELSLEYDTLVSISCIPLQEFEEYKGVLPYYKNIDLEGVRISG